MRPRLSPRGLPCLADLVGLPDPCVVLLVGASGAGKSTLAAALAATHPGLGVVSYDDHQRRQPSDNGVQTCTPAAVEATRAELAARCAAGRSSVVDGTHRQPERRAAVRAIAGAHSLPVVCVVLVVPVRVCLARQHQRARRVPAADVITHHEAITAALPRLYREGYAAVVMLAAVGPGPGVSGPRVVRRGGMPRTRRRPVGQW